MLGMLYAMPNGAEPAEVRLTRLETQIPHLGDQIESLTVSVERMRWAMWAFSGAAMLATGVGVRGEVTGMIQTVIAYVG